MEETKLVAANVAKSLRTTVPMAYVKQLELSEGDFLQWNIDKVSGEWVITIKKKR